MRSDRELCFVIAALTARGLTPAQIRHQVALFLAFQSIDRRLPVPNIDFNLDTLRLSLCIDRFRFTASQIKQLHSGLNLPATLITAQGVPVPGIEALCLVLRRLSYPCRYNDLAHEFGRHAPVLSSTFNRMLMIIYSRVAKKMEFDEMIFKMYAAESAASVFKKVGHLEKCVGFIDGTIRRICRPVVDQREVYSGFKKCHCIKFQGVMLANRLLVSLYGPIEGRRHDSFMLNSSNIGDQITDAFPDHYIYCDSGYGLKGWLIRPFQAVDPGSKEAKFNRAMSGGRISVEWFFGEVVQYWAYVDFKKGMKLGKSPVGVIYINSVFFTNALMCANGMSKTSKYFGCSLPTLEQYLSNVDPDGVACDTYSVLGSDIVDSDGDGDASDAATDAEDHECCDDCSADDEEAKDTYVSPTLPPHAREVVSTALHHGSDDEVLATINNAEISRRTLQCMLPLQWLNDEVINAWFHLLRARDERLVACQAVPRPSLFLNTFFYSKLTQGGYSYQSVGRWTKKVDLFAMENVNNAHWCLAVIYVSQKRIQFYDSMHNSGRTVVDTLLRYLKDESVDKKQRQLASTEWALELRDPNTPEQENGSDCGLFTCMFADYIARNEPLSFSQRDMEYHRQRMVLHIIQATIPMHGIL